MEVIVHLPTSETDKQELAKRLAEIHMISIRSQLEKMTCSRDDKLRFIQAVQDSLALDT